MDLAVIKEIVAMVGGISGDAKEVVTWLIIYWLLRFVLGLAVVGFLAFRALRLASEALICGMLAKKMQNDIGEHGPIIASERMRILEIWHMGLEQWKKK